MDVQPRQHPDSDLHVDGTLVGSWGQDGVFANPHQIRFDAEGNLWAVDNGANTVTKFTPDGEALLTLGTPNEPGEDPTHFNQPTDVAVTRAGDIFVSDGYVNSRVVHFDKTWKFVKAWGKLGIGPGEFSLAHGIGVDSNDHLYVVDRNNARIQVFEQSGEYITEWRNIITPWAIWITPQDEVCVCGSSPSQWRETPARGVQMNGVPPKDQTVVKFDTDGRVKQIWAFPQGTSAAGEIAWVHWMAVAANGDLYLWAIQGRRVQKFVRRAATAPTPPTSNSH